MYATDLEITLDETCPDDYARGYIGLWASVVRYAVLEYHYGLRRGWDDAAKLREEWSKAQGTGKEHKRDRLREFDSAEAWLFDDGIQPTGFLWVCSLLDIDPVRARANIKLPDAYMLAKSGKADPGGQRKISIAPTAAEHYAAFYARLITAHPMSISEIADAVGATRRQMSNATKLWLSVGLIEYVRTECRGRNHTRLFIKTEGATA